MRCQKKKIEMIQNAVGRIRTITNHMNKIEPYVGKNFFLNVRKKIRSYP